MAGPDGESSASGRSCVETGSSMVAGGSSGRASAALSTSVVNLVEPYLDKPDVSLSIQRGNLPDKSRVLDRVKWILHRFTPQTFHHLMGLLLGAGITTPSISKDVISLIFESAVSEPALCPIYAQLCSGLAENLPAFCPEEPGGNDITFKHVLLNYCQEAFECVNNPSAKVDKLTGTHQEMLRQDEQNLVQHRKFGNIQLIGELLMLKLVAEDIVHNITQVLLGSDSNTCPSEENVEAMCQFFCTIGKLLDEQSTSLSSGDIYFNRLKEVKRHTQLAPHLKVDDLPEHQSYGDHLLDVVLSWTVAEATTEDLYKSKIKIMPAQFKSISQYIEAQSDFLIEEVRARVHSAINQIQRSEFYHVLSVLEIDSSELLYFDIDVARLSKEGFNHSVKDGDVFLLTKNPPTDFKLHDSCLLGIAMEVGADNSFQKSFKMLVTRKHEKHLVMTVEFVSFLTNIAEDLSISKAISVGNFSAIKLVLEKNESSSTCSAEISALEQLTNEERYNEDQLNVIRSILSKLRCENEQSVHLIWGSPGTGKTLLACTILNCFMNSRKQILLCVPTEKLIFKLLSLLENEFPSFKFSDLIVLNAMDNIFSATSLSIRCDDLNCAVFLWSCFTKAMTSILELGIYMPEAKPVIQFSLGRFKTKFLIILRQVRYCSERLIRSLLDIYLNVHDVNKVNNMLCTLDEFEKLLKNDALKSSDLERAFGLPELSPNPSNKTVCSIATALNETRMQCIVLIKDILEVIQLPELKDWNDLESFCIKHSRIIICTPGYFSQLHDYGMKPDIMIVDDAARITEKDLLIPLLTAPIRHIVLFGDHLHVQPMMESKVCKMTGYGMSLFERLINLSFDKKLLREQYKMSPALSKMHGRLFYEDKILDGQNVRLDDFTALKFAPYKFIDISDVEELISEEENFKESSVIMYLLQDLCNGLTNFNGKISVGIVCLGSRRANSIDEQLGMQYEDSSKVSVEIISIDNLDDWYDVVILPSLCNDPYELLEGNRLNMALTCARHCLWIIGEANIFLSSPEALKKLVTYNAEPKSVVKMHNKTLSKVIQQLKMNNTTCQMTLLQKTGQEYTWNGRPHNTKYILSSVRDQKGDPDTCSFQTLLGVFGSLEKLQHACFNPPEDFNWTLSLADLKEKYELSVDTGFLKAEKGERGKQRIVRQMDILQKDGIKGSHNTLPKVENFKISGYERLGGENGVHFSHIKENLRAGKMMACHFRLSENYFYLKPGEVYKYDEEKPYIHPKSELPVSHAVMGIGFGRLPSPVPKGPNLTSVIFQNSEGPRFGIGGISKVMRQSLGGAYVMKIGDVSIGTNKEST